MLIKFRKKAKPSLEESWISSKTTSKATQKHIKVLDYVIIQAKF